jgi:branched-chain amino acid transport system permease protein
VTTPLTLDDTWALLTTPTVLTEIGAFALALLVAWLAPKATPRTAIGSLATREARIAVLVTVLLGVLLPYGIPLLLVVLANSIATANSLDMPVLAPAAALLAALLAIRIGTFLLGLSFGHGSRLSRWESRLAVVLWVFVALHMLGWLEASISALDSIPLSGSDRHITLWSVLRSLFTVSAFVVVSVWVARQVERRVHGLTDLAQSTRIGIAKFSFATLIGFGGLLSFGHAMFLGTAGYAAAHASKVWGWNPEVAVLFATLCSTALGVVVGLLAIRRQGIYFAMITLALSQMVFFFYLQTPFTGGEDGIQAVPRGHLFGVIDLADNAAMYAFVLVVFLIGFGAIWRIVHSPFGQVLKAIRENEPRALSLGYDTDLYKLVAFILSGTFAGMAGGLKSLVFQLASLTDVHWSMSGEVVLMTLVGGLGTLFGPVVGAAVIVTMQNYLAQLGAWVTVVQGVIFVVCVLAFRRGIVGELANWLKKPL